MTGSLGLGVTQLSESGTVAPTPDERQPKPTWLCRLQPKTMRLQHDGLVAPRICRCDSSLGRRTGSVLRQCRR